MENNEVTEVIEVLMRCLDEKILKKAVLSKPDDKTTLRAAASFLKNPAEAFLSR